MSRVAFSAALCVTAAALAPLPALNLVGHVSVSGISSGADGAVQFLVANSDIVNASAVFAGQAFGCAIQAFPGEPQVGCFSQPAGRQGPGCVGMPWGPAPCIGCSPPSADGLSWVPSNTTTVAYDHCKAVGGGAITDPSLLVAYARALEASGDVPPLAGLARSAVLLFRGTLDRTYNEGCVNRTQEVLQRLGVPLTRFDADVPAAHAWPTADPAVPRSSCGGGGGGPPGMENCGYDGAGEALQLAYGDSLVPPASLSAWNPAALRLFDQEPYVPAERWAGQGRAGYVYVPAACAAAPQAACRLHVALHGCGMSASDAATNTTFVRLTGLNAWGETNNIVILYPQMGGFKDYNVTAPSGQLGGSCFDGYGQSGVDFASTSGTQMLSIRMMVEALWGGSPGAPARRAPGARGRAAIAAAAAAAGRRGERQLMTVNRA